MKESQRFLVFKKRGQKLKFPLNNDFAIGF